MSVSGMESNYSALDLRSSKEKVVYAVDDHMHLIDRINNFRFLYQLMAELECDCQLSRNVVGARERVLMAALRALEEGFDEIYGPGSTALERLREVQEEVLDGREWSLLQVRRRRENRDRARARNTAL